jgi:hypothetical protein
MRTYRGLGALLAIGLVAGACDGPRHAAADTVAASLATVDPAAEIARARLDSINRARPGYVIDSILPVEEALRRFRDGSGEPPPELGGGSADRETLARRFVTALAADDTLALSAMRLSRAEFAYLVYPESRYARAPYRSAPELMWSQIARGSDKGLVRLRRRLGGQPLRFERLDCPATPEREGENQLWAACTIRIADAEGASLERRLFGSMIERHGRFKFVSYANDF